MAEKRRQLDKELGDQLHSWKTSGPKKEVEIIPMKKKLYILSEHI